MNISYSDKTYRHIEIDGKNYSGKDGFKNRKPNYIIEKFEENYFNDKTVLDLACASGAILFNIKDEVKKGVGVDVDHQKLDIGIDIAKKHEVNNLEFHLSKLEPFIDNTKENFDTIFLLNILHHVQEPYKILDIVSEISNDTICIEAPYTGYYNAYKRDLDKEVKFEGRLDLQNIIDYLEKRNFTLLVNEKSENQESFQGPTRHVCIFKKKQYTLVILKR